MRFTSLVQYDKLTSVNDDWRLRGQEHYLSGVTLHRRPYFLWRADWDHDHCEFCWVSFELPGKAGRPGEVTEGWTTDDEYRWICDSCFADFRDRFGWRVRDRIPSDRADTHRPERSIRPQGWIIK